MFHRRSYYLSLMFVFAAAGLGQLSPANPQILPGAQVGASYSNGSFAAGCPSQCGNYALTVDSGILPPGLTLNSSTGVISGFPTTAGAYTFSVQASILPVPGAFMIAIYQITVSPAAPSGAPISPAGLLLMTAGLAGVGVFGVRRLRFQG